VAPAWSPERAVKQGDETAANQARPVGGGRASAKRIGDGVCLRPFDGWDIPFRRSVIAEVYPSLWSANFAREGRTSDQHDAYSIAAWMRRADLDGSLTEFRSPDLTSEEREVARIEGWIPGVR
jgi:hypothetical protein